MTEFETNIPATYPQFLKLFLNALSAADAPVEVFDAVQDGDDSANSIVYVTWEDINHDVEGAEDVINAWQEAIEFYIPDMVDELCDDLFSESEIDLESVIADVVDVMMSIDSDPPTNDSGWHGINDVVDMIDNVIVKHPGWSTSLNVKVEDRHVTSFVVHDGGEIDDSRVIYELNEALVSAGFESSLDDPEELLNGLYESGIVIDYEGCDLHISLVDTTKNIKIDIKSV